MTSNISSMLQFWKKFNLPQLQRDLDVNAADLAGRQDASDVSRKKLVEQSKEFKKITPEDVRKSVAPLLRSFQSEVDALSKRSKASEGDFLNLYKKLIELPDPVQALEQAEHFQKRAQRLADVETENQKLRETLAEYNKEFAEVKNQEVTIKNLREKVRDYEKGKEDLAKQLTQEKNEEFQRQFVEKEKKLQETQLLIATKLGEAEQMAATYKAALESSQSELFDLKSKYDEEIAAKQAELDLVLGDLDRATQRAAISDKEMEKLRESLSSQTVQPDELKKSSTMVVDEFEIFVQKESFEALSRSSLEAELANKEKEISQLVEDVQHLQSSMGKLRDSSATAIAKLEDELNEKNTICQDLKNQIGKCQDYDEIKRELQIIKSTEFASFDSSVSEHQSPVSSAAKAKSLELLLMEKNRSQQSENTALRAANAQLTESAERRSSTPPVAQDFVSEMTHRRKERSSSSSTRYRQASTSSNQSQPNPYSPTRKDFVGVSTPIDPNEALSQLQIQNQRQLNALLNLKILAVAAQNVSAAPLLASFMNFPSNQSTTLFSNNLNDTVLRNSNLTSHRSRVPSSSSKATSAESQMIANYLSQMQKWSSENSPLENLTRPLSHFSDHSDDENSVLSRRSGDQNYFSNKSVARHPSDPTVSSIGDRELPNCSTSRYRSLSHTGEATRAEDVRTDELTRQVKEVLQANNIGQRAFGQYVLGLSQGSVSEILSKPKPWCKLTFKGKEPFYKMMDFLASEKNVESLKSLQRRDREERVLCGSRTQSVRNSDARSEQAIADILAVAREEMRAEQEKLKKAQEKYSYEKSGNSDIDKHIKGRKDSDAEDLNSSSSSRLSMTDAMIAIASGRCSANMPTRSEKINVSATNGAVESRTIPTPNPSLSSSIKNRVCAVSGSVNGRPLLQDNLSDKEDSEADLQNLQKLNENLNVSSEDRRTLDKDDIKSSTSSFASKGKKVAQASTFVSGRVTIKTEPADCSHIVDYLTAVSKQGKLPSKDVSSVTSKEEVLSQNRCLIGANVEQDSLRKFYSSTTYNDPFIPPPLSPAVEDTRSSSRSESTCSPNIDKDIAYRSSFVEEQSSCFIGDNSEHSENSRQTLCHRRVDKSPASPNSTGLLQEPVLFKELTCSNFEDSNQDRDNTTKTSSVATTSFSGMMSSGMSSLHTSTSLFDSHASYTELSPVTSGSLYRTQRETQEHDLASLSSAFPGVENGQNGISSMLPPLVASGSQPNVSSSVPTYSTLTNTMTSEVSLGDDNFDGDHSGEESSFNSQIPYEAIQQFTMTPFDTAVLTKQVRDRLVRHGICQRVFGEKILGLSQGTVSDILSHPKTWNKLTHKGKEPFARMILWMADNTAGGLLPPHEDMSRVDHCDNLSRSSSTSPNTNAMNLTSQASNPPSSLTNGGLESGTQFITLSPRSSMAQSPHSVKSQERVSPTNPANGESSPLREPCSSHFDKHFKADTPVTPEQSNNGHPITPLQQMLNIQELASSCPKLDTFALTRKVKDLLTEHNIGQRIFGQAVLGLTQGSVSDLLSRPKLWTSLSLKGREPFVRMQLWLSDPNNIEQLKSLKMERWMEKKWNGKRQRPDNAMHSLSPVKKQRIVLSSEEKEVLRRAYAIEPYPSQETVDLLAGKLNRKSSTIVNWFHNYRSRVKRGFFPGEEVQDSSSKKHSGSKITVKQLLDGITLSRSHNDNSSTPTRSNNLNPQRPFSSKPSHSDVVGTSSSRRGSARSTVQVSNACWGRPQHVQSPSNFERFPPESSMKTETLDQHFQNLHPAASDDIYTSPIMHVKDEAKLLQMHSGDAMFNSSYSYPMSNAMPDMFKPPESSCDPVAIAAASAFIPPKQIHDGGASHFTSSPGQLFTNLDNPHSHHHDNYASIPNESSFTPISASKVSVSPPSPQSNSILPPVHTLTPKKPFGPPNVSSNLTLPSASSLLSLPQPSIDGIPMEAATMGFTNPQNNQSSHRLMSLTRPRYGTLVASNNNMNNNSQANVINNLPLPGGVSLRVPSPARSPSEQENKIKATVWVSSPNDATNVTSQENLNSSASIKSEDSVLDAIPDKDNSDDCYSWVF